LQQTSLTTVADPSLAEHLHQHVLRDLPHDREFGPTMRSKFINRQLSGELETAVQTLRSTYPKGPTSLHAAFNAARALEPKPDNIYLLVDGLPTMGEIIPTRPGVTGRERIDHFNRATRQLPIGVPINVILFAMEGDPQAAPAFWMLALRTGGSMLAPRGTVMQSRAPVGTGQ